MVVFGAGASYDSVPSRPPGQWPPQRLPARPPLADELFDDRPEFVMAMKSFPECQPIVPYLQRIPSGSSLERVMQELQAEGPAYAERYRQLAAVKFYLHFMLWRCELTWNDVANGVTNYKTLLDQIERWRKSGEVVCIVTFNYDTLLESALRAFGLEIRDLSEYISTDRYKIIKLHGSVNWAREVNTAIPDLAQMNTWETAYRLIRGAATLDISDRFIKVTEYPIGRSDDKAIFPAIALPVESKTGYECPAAHLEMLKSCISRVDKLLLVGWRATETDFLKLLRETLPGAVRCLTVAGSDDLARQTVDNIQRAGIEGDFRLAKGGFTDLVVARAADPFLRS